MDKKPYSAPKLIKVKLEVRQSVLGTCNDTTTTSPGEFGTRDCLITFCLYPMP